MATDINIIEINKLKLLTCILLNPHANIIAVAIIIINQWIGFPKNILFMSMPSTWNLVFLVDSK